MPNPRARTTLPGLLARNAQTRGARPALREKRLGIWHEQSWTQTLAHSRALALGLGALGARRGDRIGIIGDNRPEFYQAMLAAQMLGAVAVPLFADATAAELTDIVARARLGIIIAEDQEQVDKCLAARATAGAPIQIVFKEGRGLEEMDGTAALSLPTLIHQGRGWDGDLDAEIALGQPDDIAVIAFTAATSGPAKGVMLSHANLLAAAAALADLDGLNESDNILAWLPMAWVGEMAFSVTSALLAGACLSCPENAETALSDMREIGPSRLIFPPRILQTLHANVLARMAGAGGLKRRLFAAAQTDGGWLHELLIRAPLRNALGLGRARHAYVVGDGLAPDAFGFFRAMGLNLKQLYGLTEASGLLCVQRDGATRAGAVGVPAPGVELRLGEDGEVQARGLGIFAGYLGDETASAAARTADGWLRTGDAGMMDADGQWRILGRRADMGVLTNGTAFIPALVESRLREVPYIREAIALGDGHACVACLVELDTAAAGARLERQGKAVAGARDLPGREDIAALIASCIAQANPDLGTLAVRRFAILPGELDADEGELTRMRKPRRAVILARHAGLVSALFAAGAGTWEVPA